MATAIWLRRPHSTARISTQSGMAEPHAARAVSKGPLISHARSGPCR
ncbi:MAG: hypothetical protein ACOH2H_15210 [Cypionkella sp.]